MLRVDGNYKLFAGFPKIGRGLYIAEVVELTRKVRDEARVGWGPALRIAIAIYEKRLP